MLILKTLFRNSKAYKPLRPLRKDGLNVLYDTGVKDKLYPIPYELVPIGAYFTHCWLTYWGTVNHLAFWSMCILGLLNLRRRLRNDIYKAYTIEVDQKMSKLYITLYTSMAYAQQNCSFKVVEESQNVSKFNIQRLKFEIDMADIEKIESSVLKQDQKQSDIKDLENQIFYIHFVNRKFRKPIQVLPSNNKNRDHHDLLIAYLAGKKLDLSI